LKFRTQYGVNYQSVEDKTFYNSLHGDGIQTTATTDDGTAFNAIGKYNTTNFQNYFTYEFDFNKEHNFYFTVGHEETANNSDRWSGKRSGLSDQFFNEFQGNFTVNDNPNSTSLTENYLLSYFGRVNYNYKNKYYVSMNVRQDEYSAFAAGKKKGIFYGGGLGWTISEEGFWKGNISNTINLLKIRGSYGTLGNISSVGNFASLSTFGSFQYGNGLPTLFFSQAGNQDLQWEASNKMDLGLQFELFKGRISGEVTYFETKLKDLIIDVPTPTSLGIPGNSISANAAQMYNKGVEVSITGQIIAKKDFTWTATINYTTIDNQVTALANGVPEIVGTTQLERTNITRIGSQIGSFFVVKTLGVDPATGRRIFQNAAGQKVLFDFSSPAAQRWKFEDGTIAPAIDLGKDGYIAGNSTPTYFGGITNSFSYKGFDLLVDAIFSGGNKIYFGSRAGMLDQRFWNNTTDVLRRWTKAGDQTDIPRVVYNDNISNGSAIPIDANLFDGAYIKFRTISLGYTFPRGTMEKIGLGSLRIYSSILNAFTITNYPGSDPEVSVNGNSALTPGVDRNTIGQARTFTFGLNVGF
jgi:TonB-dependent starch-binding outer membrane protein SusC